MLIEFQKIRFIYVYEQGKGSDFPSNDYFKRFNLYWLRNRMFSNTRDVPTIPFFPLLYDSFAFRNERERKGGMHAAFSGN